VLRRTCKLTVPPYLIVLSLTMLAACASGDLTLNEADPDIVARKPTFEQVYPIFQRECIPCHAGTDQGSGDDNSGDDDEREIRKSDDVPSARLLDLTASSIDPGLESCESIVANLDDIIEDIFVNNDMPPGAWPRLTSKEKLTIERWIDGGAEESCN